MKVIDINRNKKSIVLSKSKPKDVSISNIRASLDRINLLMAELRNMATQEQRYTDGKDKIY